MPSISKECLLFKKGNIVKMFDEDYQGIKQGETGIVIGYSDNETIKIEWDKGKRVVSCFPSRLEIIEFKELEIKDENRTRVFCDMEEEFGEKS